MMKLNRRTFVRGSIAGGTLALGLPLLEAMLDTHGEALANGDPLPQRFGVWLWGNGTPIELWVPSGAGEMWTPSPCLQALDAADVRPKVTIVSGMQANSNAGDHISTMTATLGGDADSSYTRAPTQSMSPDQLAADQFGATTPFKSIQLGISNSPASTASTPTGPSWRDGTWMPAELDPRALFHRLFAGEFDPESDVRDDRLSILDGVLADAARLRQRISSADAQRLDAHLDGLRAIETRLSNEAMACTLPPEPAARGMESDSEPLEALTSVMADIMGVALACDLTRVFTVRFNEPVSETLFSDVGAQQGFHSISHTQDRELYAACVGYIMARFADLVRHFDQIPEGTGTLLDNCAILATSDLTDGYSHTSDDMPLVIAGSAGGKLRTGIHVASPANSVAASVPLTMLRAAGVEVGALGLGNAQATQDVPELLA